LYDVFELSIMEKGMKLKCELIEVPFNYKILSITRQPHYYETKWFLAFCIFFFFALILIVSKWYNRYATQRNLELELLIAEKNAGLQETNIVLSEKIKQNDLFQSILAHDIKAPLRFIESNTKLLHDHWFLIKDNDKLQNLNYIKDTATKIQIFVDETLLWIQIRNGELETQKSRFVIYDLLKENIDLVEKDSKVLEGKISLQVDCDPGLHIYSDRILSSTVVRNLLSNSIKFSKSGIITLFAQTIAKGQIVIGCKDEGKGMDAALINMLLLEDYRGNSIRKDSFRLGYVIIKEIARLLNANLKIESKVGLGTNVSLIFQSE
jgi:K+-sensing histidine kinase KdpD